MVYIEIKTQAAAKNENNDLRIIKSFFNFTSESMTLKIIPNLIYYLTTK